jgi:mRNA interferase RelE/StbE
MKAVIYNRAALRMLAKNRVETPAIISKIRRYAETGAGDVKKLQGEPSLRLRVGEFRVIFEENAFEIHVTKIGPRGAVYK